MTFYKGLSAIYYDQFFQEPDQQELQFYEEVIKSAPPAPALEIACGTGRVLLPLLQKGLSVEGFDNSPQMLEVLKQKAAQTGAQATVYLQSMQTLALPKKYGCLFSPLGSFGQLAQLQDAYVALQRFYKHLVPGGILSIYLYLPWHNAPEFGLWHEHDVLLLPDGKALCVFEHAVHDVFEQQVHMRYRYEVWQGQQLLTTEQKEMSIRWYSRHEFELMLRSVGFEHIQVQAGYCNDGPADVMLFVAR